MTKLKTLEELGFKVKETNNGIGLYTESELKAEAIKWIKNLEGNMCLGNEKWKSELEGKIRWIKMFFNLTKEDLKE